MDILRKNWFECIVTLLHGILLAWHTHHEIEIGEFKLEEIKHKEGLLELGATLVATLAILIFIIRLIREIKKSPTNLDK